MHTVKSQFVFNAQQRFGILLLILLITACLSLYFFLPTSEVSSLDISSSEVIRMQRQLDSLRCVEIENRKPKIYPFNPNYLTDYRAYTLGISPKELDKLQYFRSKNQWINSSEDFKNVTGVSDSLLAAISPLFKFPEWVNKPRTYKKPRTYSSEEKPFDQKKDLNTALAEDLTVVYGIGSALSQRIIAYREKLDGFSADAQLYSVWGLNDTVVKRLLNEFTVKTPKEIKRLNVNTASASDIATIPGISFELAKEIWEFRILRERIHSVSELEKIDGLSSAKFKLIMLYLFAE